MYGIQQKVLAVKCLQGNMGNTILGLKSWLIQQGKKKIIIKKLAISNDRKLKLKYGIKPQIEQ